MVGGIGELADLVGQSPVALDAPDGALIDEHRDELLDEERVAFGGAA